MGTFVIVVGGGELTSQTQRSGPRSPGSPTCRARAVIAVDSGLDVALAAGLVPTVLVGDLDSVSTGGLAWARRHAVEIESHPSDKEATDTALALATARTSAAGDPDAVLHVLCGAATDRLDHVLGIVTALGAADLAAFREIRCDIGATQIRVLHAGHAVSLDLASGAVFSLLALHGPCSGVDVESARWPLANATLRPADTVGISNESLGVPVAVRTRDGVLTVVVPGVAS